MVETIKSKVVIMVIALMLMLGAFMSIGTQPAQASHGYYGTEYAAWLSECYWGGYSWYDFYYHGTYYWDWC
jgi:hypothetical protein